MRGLSLCWDSPHLNTQNLGFCTVKISLDTIYQTNCQSWTTQYHDRSIDGLPKVQSLVLCESQIKSMYSIVRPSPFQFYGTSLGPIGSKRWVSIDVAMGPTDVKEACLSSFSNSDPSCSEIFFTHGPVLNWWSHVLNVIGPSARTKHFVLQFLVNLLPSWMTLNWSHFLDFDVFWRDNIQIIYYPHRWSLLDMNWTNRERFHTIWNGVECTIKVYRYDSPRVQIEG